MMKTAAFTVYLFILTLVLAGTVLGEETTAQTGVRFKTANIVIDTNNQPIAAYQVELLYDRERVIIVGLEGGAIDGFGEPPFYDRIGLEGGRIILAAFILDDSKAPQGKICVSRIHLRVAGAQPIVLSARVITAAKPGGDSINISAEVVIVETDTSANSSN
jgi:hypothetical protein